jgi:serine/threonine-protein kinase PRP4
MVVDGCTMTDSLDRKRRSRSRENLLERKGEDKSVDVKKHRSKAKDSAREQTLMEEIKLERHRRSRESMHDRKDNGQEGSRDSSERNREKSRRDGRAHGEVRGMEERRRSRSKESLLNPKVEDCVRSKWESPSKENVQDKVRENIRKSADCCDSKGYSSQSNDAPAQGKQNHQQEQEFSRHEGWADKSHVRNHKETCEWMRADSLDKRQRLHSRDGVWEWEHRDGSRQRGCPYEVYERSSSRYGGHGNESSNRGHNHDRHGCNGSHQSGVQDRSSRANKYLNRDKHVEKDKSHGHDEKCVPRDETKRKIEEDAREEENEEEYKERIELQLAAQEEDDVERIKEESRRRRQAILEKYKQLQQQKSNVEQLSDIFTDDSSKQPEEQGQLVAAVGTNLVKQTNDDAVSLDKVYCQNGDTSVQAMPEIRLDEGSSPKVIFYFS